MALGGSVRINKCGVVIASITICLLFYYMLYNGSSAPYRRLDDQVNLRKLLIAGIQAAQLGGLEVLYASNDIQAKSKGRTKEGANDPVTNADLRSHCAMERGLKRLFPKVTVISEELADCSESNHIELDPTVIEEDIYLPDDHLVNAGDVTVWIDPLDATQEYTGKYTGNIFITFRSSCSSFCYIFPESLFEYVTTMVCVAVNGIPSIGIIHNPFTAKTVWAWDGVAVASSLKSIRDAPINRMQAAKNPKVMISRSHTGDVENLLKVAFGENVPITKAGGAGYKVLQVVYGNATNYIHATNIKKWDICAGNAILNALNGDMTTLKNQPIRFGSDPTAYVNSEGLIASLRNHDYYAKKVYNVLRQVEMLKEGKL